MRTSTLALLLAALGAAASVAACSSSSHDGDPAPDTTATLKPTAVVWNPSNVDVGTVQAVAEQDQSLVVFGSKGVQTLTSGSVVATDPTITTWKAAAVVPSSDGLSTWMVGVDSTGHVQRVPSDGPIEDVSARYGLAVGTDKVDSVVAGTARVAFLLDSGVAVSDGKNVTRYQVPARAVVASAGLVALADTSAVRIIDQGKETDVALPDAQLVAYDAMGNLLAATTHALYQVKDGAATRLYDAGARTIHGLAGAGAGVWLAVDGDLGIWQNGGVSISTGGTLAADARLFGSASGDLWVITGGQLLRWSAKSAAVLGDEAVWNSTVLPIYSAVCSNCHSAPGTDKYSSNIDLSTYALWTARRAAVYTRVVSDVGMTTQMPPPTSGFAITDAQRAAIQAWSKP